MRKSTTIKKDRPKFSKYSYIYSCSHFRSHFPCRTVSINLSALLHASLVHKLFIMRRSFFHMRHAIQNLLIADIEILDLPKHLTEENGKCIKCKREQRNALCVPCGHLVLCWSCTRDTDYCCRCNAKMTEKIHIFT